MGIFNQSNQVVGEIKIKYKETSNLPIKKGKKINFKHSFTIYSIHNIINQNESEVEQYNDKDLFKFGYTAIKKEDGNQSAGGGQRIDSNTFILDLGFDNVINDQKSAPVEHTQHDEQTDTEIQREQSDVFKKWKNLHQSDNQLTTEGESPKKKKDASLSSSKKNDKVGEFDKNDISSENHETVPLIKGHFNKGLLKDRSDIDI